MKVGRKIAVVLGGYVLAVLVAYAVLQAYVASTHGPDRQTYAAMFDFGDGIVFLAAFGVASLPASGAALCFMRGYHAFWAALSTIAVMWAATGAAALFALLAPFPAPPHSWLRTWAGLSPLRALVAPLFVLIALLAGMLAPIRSSRIALLVVAASEAAVFVSAVIHWADPHGVG